MKDRASRALRDLRISVIDRCNFRCPYCMPAEHYGEHHAFLPRSHWLTAGEIRRVASLFVQLGVTKIRLTGGEPLLRRDIVEIVESLASLEGVEDLALTTNGTRLAERAAELKAAGLKRLTVSLDSLDERVFKEMNGGRGDLETVLAGHRGREPRRLRAAENQRGDRARQERPHGSRPRRALPRHEHDRAVHRIHGRWDRERLAPRAGRPVEGAARANRGALAARAARQQLPRRGCEALRFQGRAGRDRVHLVSQRTVLRRLPSSAALGRRHRLHLSVRVARHRAAQRAARGRERRGPRRSACKTSGAIATTVTARSAGRLLEHKSDAAAKKTERVEMYRMGG